MTTKQTILSGLALFACYAIASELEYRDHINLERARYEQCLSAGAPYVITDLEVSNLIANCED